jgi:RHS repeat-associated protein
LITAAVSYAAAQYSSGSGTGLYISLNCEYSTAAANTSVPLLDGVEGIGTAGSLKVRGSLACADNGAVNKWEAAVAGTFGALTSASLQTSSWPSPSCPVEEAFNSWPGMFTPVGYDAGSDVTQNFTASNGVIGEPYILLGAQVSTATAALAPGTGGEVPAGATVAGGNVAAPGLVHAMAADPVDTETGDFTQSATDFSIPGFGPALDFTRTYDARLARLQTVAGVPGPLGYGWTDNWATSLTLNRPVLGDIYRVTNPGQSFASPQDVALDANGDMFIADTGDSRVEEIAAYTHTQFGIPMTAGNAYRVAGSSTGASGNSANGTAAASALMNAVSGVALDAAGNLYIVDMGNSELREVPAATGTQWGRSMTANDLYTIAGSTAGTAGSSGDNGPASSSLLDFPQQVRVDAAGNLYIADELNFRVQEIAKATGTQRGVSMTANDIYTIAGKTGTNGDSGDSGLATSATLDQVDGLALDSAGDVFVSDSWYNVVREVAGTTGTQWGKSMTANHIYTMAGNAQYAGNDVFYQLGDGGPATAAALGEPAGLALDSAGDLFIADLANNRIQEVPAASGTQWGKSMTAGDMYTALGSAGGTFGNTGDGGPATSALLDIPQSVAVDSSGNLYVPDRANNRIREVFATTSQLFGLNPAGTGITVNQADGSQVTFYPKVSNACTAPYVAASGSAYCTLPQNVTATLNSVGSTYTYQPDPGITYTYKATGALTSETDTAGNILTVLANNQQGGSGTCPASAASCTTITAASGRSLVLGLSASLVTSVTDPMGRQWTYGYTNNQLTSAVDPMGHITSYSYGAGSTGNPQLASDLLTITNPNGQQNGPVAGHSTGNVYDSAGRVTSQTDPMGYTTAFNYCVNATVGDCMNAATGSGFDTVTDPDGNQTVYYYLQGSMAAQSEWTNTGSGLILTSENDIVPDTAAASISNPGGGTMLATSSLDGDNRTATSSYDAVGNRTSATSLGENGAPSTITSGYAEQSYTTERTPNCTSSAAASATCGADPGPAPVAAGQVISPPSQIPVAGVSWTQYDNTGNDLYTEIGVSQPGGGSTAQVTYELHNGNSVTLPGTSTSITCANVAPSLELPCATINSSGMVAQLKYDSAGDLLSNSIPNGYGAHDVTTSYSYDADGEQVGTTSPNGNLPNANVGNYTTTTTYNADGQQVSVSDGSGAGHTVTPRTSTTAYDADGNPVTATGPRGYITTTAYNADDESVLVTDATGNATLTCYDGDQHAVQTVPPAGVAGGSLTPSSCPTAYPAGYGTRLAADATVSTYNGAGEVIQQTTPLPPGQTGPNSYETTTMSYDSNGNLVETLTPAVSAGGQSIASYTTYNPAGEVQTQTTGYGTAAASTISYCYDPEGNKTSVVTADGNQAGVAPCQSSAPWTVSAQAYPAQAAHQTVYTYNTADQLVSVLRPGVTSGSAGATTTYTYDSGGALLSATNPDGVTSTMAYTPDGQLASISYSGSSAPQVTYTYDAEDHPTVMTDGTGTSTRIYDPFGELTSVTSAGQTVSYTYDGDGNRTGVTYPLPATATWAASSTVTYTYDKADTLAAVTDLNGNQETITRNRDGQPSAVSLGTSGDTLNFAYGQNDTPSSIALQASGGNSLQSFAYTYAPGNQLLNETDTPSSAGSPTSYAYDARGRLTSATPGTGTSLSYTYDSSGNLLTLPTIATASYGNNDELTNSTLSGTSTSYAYDADGNRLVSSQGGSAVTSATWNGVDELTGYTAPAVTMTGATYDANGHRAAATFTTSAGTNPEGYVWDGDSLLMDSTNAYIYAGSRYTPVEQVNLATGVVTYLVTDSLGSVRGTVNSAGALTGTTSYDAWGNPQTPAGLTAATPFGYAGGYTDPDGLIYLINRYYDPQTGQFISVDPLVDQTFAPYAYTGGDPVGANDPTGEACLDHWETAIPSCRFQAAANYTGGKIRDVERTDTFGNIQNGISLGPYSPTYWAALVWFFKEVRPNGPWDLKTSLANTSNPHYLCNLANMAGEAGELCQGNMGWARVTANKQIFLNVWGNVLYGYIGMHEGIDSFTLQALVNILGYTNIDPTFTNPGNRNERQMGIDMAKYPPTGGSMTAVIKADLYKFGNNECDLLPYPDYLNTRDEKIKWNTCLSGSGAKQGW